MLELKFGCKRRTWKRRDGTPPDRDGAVLPKLNVWVALDVARIDLYRDEVD